MVVSELSLRFLTHPSFSGVSYKLSTRLHEHQLAIRRHDQLSLMSAHEDMTNHKFDLSATKILSQTNTRHGREFLEAWFLHKYFYQQTYRVRSIIRARDLARQNHSCHETTAEPDIELHDTSQGRCWRFDPRNLNQYIGLFDCDFGQQAQNTFSRYLSPMMYPC